MAAKKKGFQRKKVEVLTLGERLYKLRKESQVSMAEFSKHTKIQVKYLRALEEGLYDKLPSVVYIKGFLRAYEHFFDLKEDVLLKIFDKEYRIYHNIHDTDDHSTRKLSRVEKRPRIIITSKVLLSIVTVIVFLGIGGYLYYGVNQYVSAPLIDIEEPLNGTRTQEQVIMVRGTTHPDAQLTIGGKEVFVDRDGVFYEEVGLTPGENTITVRSSNATDKVSERVLNIYSSFVPAAPAENVPEESSAESVHLTLTIGEIETWIAIVADGIDVFSATVPAGSEHMFNAEKSISITAGRGDMVRVNVNGEDRGTLSENDAVVRDVVFQANAQQEEEVEDAEKNVEKTF